MYVSPLDRDGLLQFELEPKKPLHRSNPELRWPEYPYSEVSAAVVTPTQGNS